MISISPIGRNHCHQVAKLHLQYLHTPYRGLPGQRLLSLYYMSLTADQGGHGFVACDQQIILGYVCGIWNPRLVRSLLLKKYMASLALWGIVQGCTYPEIGLLVLCTRGNKNELYEEGYELRPIVVSPHARGTGVAASLVEELKQDALMRGYHKIHLYTELDNMTARRFYTKMGFSEDGVIRQKTASYIKYKLRLAS